jgi:hypothetical protein
LAQDYVLEVLMVDPAVWGEIQSPTLSQSVRLCHLQYLFTYLEERMDGSPLDNVAFKYRNPLPEPLLLELR